MLHLIRHNVVIHHKERPPGLDDLVALHPAGAGELHPPPLVPEEVLCVRHEAEGGEGPREVLGVDVGGRPLADVVNVYNGRVGHAGPVNDAFALQHIQQRLEVLGHGLNLGLGVEPVVVVVVVAYAVLELCAALLAVGDKRLAHQLSLLPLGGRRVDGRDDAALEGCVDDVVVEVEALEEVALAEGPRLVVRLERLDLLLVVGEHLAVLLADGYRLPVIARHVHPRPLVIVCAALLAALAARLLALQLGNLRLDRLQRHVVEIKEALCPHRLLEL
mmetsp:Transcript_16760/g.42333  ORF Transcript_16760/g.42333 Transcript_16760/m.42333 type:complete len:275 (-) Transcript_16760:74-898(-)